METKEKTQFNEQIRERTIKMAVAIHELLVNLKVSPVTRPIVNQVIRSSSSVASNYRAATRSRSDAEFYSKICIVVEEVDETQFWLDYLQRLHLLDNSKSSGIFNEVEELVKLFTAIKSKMKSKLNS
ncbi:MAG TPA: four helix bundle protein [Bacteroidales bacterium]|nr:four helix bundle protein [Bacteroidales bacterium]HPS61525.1 four helix bundle protein [Bacteroidales bacterium]